MSRALDVAVIGAGPAGLATARELKREGHAVVIFEKSDQVGGIWAYDPQVEEDPMGIDPNQETKHCSIYRAVKTTLPKEIMGFADYPFTVRDKHGVLKEFPGHEEVHQYLQNFAHDFDLYRLVRFSAKVVRVEQTTEEGLWTVGWMSESGGVIIDSEELFDAVVICNGHYSVPNVVEIPGIEKWSGKQIHSHNYRVPESYQDQMVVVIGDGISAHDISLDISPVAKEVHIVSRAVGIVSERIEGCDNIWYHPKIIDCYGNGDILFEDRTIVNADAIIHCTGYKYAFPFLNTNDIVTIDDNRVGPLYKHIFPPQLAPSLSFVGIPFRCNNYHMMEIQAKWVASVLTQKVSLPSKEEMLADVEEHYRQLEEKGIPKRFTHKLPSDQYEYLDWIVVEAKLPPIPQKTKEITRRIFGVADAWVRFRELYGELTRRARSIDEDHHDIILKHHLSLSFKKRKSFKLIN